MLCRRCLVLAAPPSCLPLGLHEGRFRHSCRPRTPLWLQWGQVTGGSLSRRVCTAAGDANATATLQQPHAEPETEAFEVSAGEQVIRRADELAARVRQDPTDENAHMALLRHLEEYAAEHSALLPLVEEELARLGLDSESSDPGRPGPRTRQQGRPTEAIGAAHAPDGEDWNSGLGGWLDDTDPEALPIGPDGRLGPVPSEVHSKVLFDEDDIYYDVGDKGLYKVAGGPTLQLGVRHVDSQPCPGCQLPYRHSVCPAARCRTDASTPILRDLWAGCPSGLPSPAVLLAGLRAEEYAMVRALLDSAGGHGVRVLPCRGDALHGSLAQALAAPEPDWAAPRPPDWTRGGEWGSQRVALFCLMRRTAQDALVELLEEAGLPPVCVADALVEELGMQLGAVLAAAVQAQRGRRAPQRQLWEDSPRMAAVLPNAAEWLAGAAASSPMVAAESSPAAAARVTDTGIGGLQPSASVPMAAAVDSLAAVASAAIGSTGTSEAIDARALKAAGVGTGASSVPEASSPAAAPESSPAAGFRTVNINAGTLEPAASAVAASALDKLAGTAPAAVASTGAARAAASSHATAAESSPSAVAHAAKGSAGAAEAAASSAPASSSSAALLSKESAFLGGEAAAQGLGEGRGSRLGSEGRAAAGGEAAGLTGRLPLEQGISTGLRSRSGPEGREAAVLEDVRSAGASFMDAIASNVGIGTSAGVDNSLAVDRSAPTGAAEPGTGDAHAFSTASVPYPGRSPGGEPLGRSGGSGGDGGEPKGIGVSLDKSTVAFTTQSGSPVVPLDPFVEVPAMGLPASGSAPAPGYKRNAIDLIASGAADDSWAQDNEWASSAAPCPNPGPGSRDQPSQQAAPPFSAGAERAAAAGAATADFGESKVSSVSPSERSAAGVAGVRGGASVIPGPSPGASPGPHSNAAAVGSDGARIGAGATASRQRDDAACEEKSLEEEEAEVEKVVAELSERFAKERLGPETDRAVLRERVRKEARAPTLDAVVAALCCGLTAAELHAMVDEAAAVADAMPKTNLDPAADPAALGGHARDDVASSAPGGGEANPALPVAGDHPDPNPSQAERIAARERREARLRAGAQPPDASMESGAVGSGSTGDADAEDAEGEFVEESRWVDLDVQGDGAAVAGETYWVSGDAEADDGGAGEGDRGVQAEHELQNRPLGSATAAGNSDNMPAAVQGSSSPGDSAAQASGGAATLGAAAPATLAPVGRAAGAGLNGAARRAASSPFVAPKELVVGPAAGGAASAAAAAGSVRRSPAKPPANAGPAAGPASPLALPLGGQVAARLRQGGPSGALSHGARSPADCQSPQQPDLAGEMGGAIGPHAKATSGHRPKPLAGSGSALGSPLAGQDVQRAAPPAVASSGCTAAPVMNTNRNFTDPTSLMRGGSSAAVSARAGAAAATVLTAAASGAADLGSKSVGERCKTDSQGEGMVDDGGALSAAAEDGSGGGRARNLTAAELRDVAQRRGLTFEALVADMRERGIDIDDA